MGDAYVKNPITGRKIIVGGRTFNALKKQGYFKSSMAGGSEWSAAKPKSRRDRDESYDKCGRKCFLMPNERKFPVCRRGSCEYDCDGLKSADRLARLNGYELVSHKAKRIQKRIGCK
jgi:hypothetical protein